MKARKAIALTVAALGIFAGTAGATPIKWVSVELGTHRFGHLRAPDAVVAHAGPTEVAFKTGAGCGCLDGPGGPVSFAVAPNGAIWLFDVLNHRLLAWKPGRPARPARVVQLSKELDVRDFALGRDGTIYLFAVYAEPPPGDSGANLWALSPSGRVRWRAHALMGNALRVAPDGTLYSVGARRASPAAWTPLTTAAGRPLSLAAQRRRTTAFQPLGGGLHLVASQIDAHEVHFALVDRSHKVVRAWRVHSRTAVALERRVLTPALVAGDLVVDVDVSRQTAAGVLWEHVVLRLGSTGSPDRVSLDAKAVWGDDGTGMSTPLRVGSGGTLYQLRTNPKTGATVARYALGSRRKAS